jgi:tetratricopeptide (TPR) repeat protein
MARKIFSDVVEVSKTPRALAELALTCLVIEDCDCAIQLLLEAVEIDHLFDRGWRGLAQCYNNANDFEKALEAAERAIAINPNHYRNWQAKSDVLLSLRQFDKVLGTSQKGIELIQSLAEKEEAKPVWSVLHLQRFHAFLELQRVADALTEASLARMEIPDDSRFFSLPVQILLSTNHSEQALDILDSASDPIVKDELAPLRYKTLHQLGRGEEAWNFIRPHLEKNTEKRLNILANIGVEFYQRGLRVPAIAVYRQLVNFKPADARFANNLGYFLIENGQLSEAEGLLTAVLENPEAGLYAEIARCNMAYLFNLIGKYPQALDASTAVLNSEFVQETAILRVPFWANGKIQPDPAPIPGRELVLADAAWACAATSALANGQISQAQNFVDKLLLESPDQILAGMMAGCLEAAKGNLSGAADLWNQLINVSEQSPEAAVLKTWLAQLT